MSSGAEPKNRRTGDRPGGFGGSGRSLRTGGQHLDVDALTAYLDHALDDSERQVADTHLAICADCRHELSELGATVTLLHGLPQYAPRHSFQLGPEHARLGPRPSGWFTRLLPALPALRLATIAVAVLLVAVTAGDLILGGRGDREPAAPSSGVAVPSAAVISARQQAPAPVQGVADQQQDAGGTKSTDLASERVGGTSPPSAASEASGQVSSPGPDSIAGGGATPGSAPTRGMSNVPSWWRLAEVGLGLILMWLLVTVVGVERLRRRA
jgi:hypothetical protein